MAIRGRHPGGRCRGLAFAMALLLPAAPARPETAAAGPALDARTALIVVDLQQSMLSRPTLEPVDSIVARARRVAEAFRRKGLPVVLVRSATQPPGRTRQPHRPGGVADPSRSELLPSLGAQRADHVISKRGWSAFSHTDLARYLRDRRVTQLVILGYSTSIGVESTARQAYDMGYNVTIVADATTDTGADVHQAAMEKIFPRLGEIATAEQIARGLEQR